MKQNAATKPRRNGQKRGKPPEQIGEKIRAKRRSLGRTLQNLADETGFSLGFLSQIERGVTTPSLSSLTLVAAALDVSPSYFLDQPAGKNTVSKRRDRAEYSIGSSEISYERLSDQFEGSTMNSVKANIQPGYESEKISHEGEEFVFVISGKIQYVIEDEKHELSAGDALHFDARRPHSIRNPNDEPAETLSVVTLRVF